MGEVNWDRVIVILRKLDGGNFGELVSAIGSYNWWRGRPQFQEAAQLAADLHTAGDIDLVFVFGTIVLETGEGSDKLAKSVATFFWEVLPKLDVDAALVIDCLTHLQDTGCLGAELSWYDESLTAWSRLSADRALHFMQRAIASPATPTPGLVYMLVAGAELDPQGYLTGAMSLVRCVGTDAAQSAIAAIGAMTLSDAANRKAAVACLSDSLQDSNETTAAKAAAFRSLLQVATKEGVAVVPWLRPLLDSAPNFLEALPLRTVIASMFNCRPAPPPEPFLQFAFDQLVTVTASETETIQRIDHALYGRIGAGDIRRSTELVAGILVRDADISMDDFHMFLSALAEQEGVLHDLILRWLLRGPHDLCEAVVKILNEIESDTFTFKASTVMNAFSDAEKVRLCRRAMGYLLHLPLAAASVLVAAMEQSDEQTAYRLGNLLFRPVLSSYPGTVHKYLLEVVEELSGIPQAVVRKVLAAFDQHHSALTAVGRIRELEPSESERFIASERRATLMAEADARAKPSALADLFPRVIMLYGNKSVFNVYGGPGEKPRRSITPMMTYSVSYEFPRDSMLDPIGQMYQQYSYRFRDDDL